MVHESRFSIYFLIGESPIYEISGIHSGSFISMSRETRVDTKKMTKKNGKNKSRISKNEDKRKKAKRLDRLSSGAFPCADLVTIP